MVFDNKQKTDDEVVATTSDVKNPAQGTSETHVNAFLYDLDQAFKEAHAALGEVEVKYNALRSRLGL